MEQPIPTPTQGETPAQMQSNHLHRAMDAFLKPQVEDKPQDPKIQEILARDEIRAEEPKEQEGKDEAPEKEQTAQEPTGQPKYDPKTDIINQRFSALAKRERFLSQKEHKIREQGKKLTDLEQEKNEFEKDPYKYLEKKGHTYENWTKKILSGDTPSAQSSDEIKEIKSELDLIKKEKLEYAKQVEENRRYETYTSEINRINQVIQEHRDKYPSINFFGDHQLVFDIRAEKFKQDSLQYGEDYAKDNVLSIEDAAQLAEDYRNEYIKEKKESLKPFQSKLATFFQEENKGNGEDKPHEAPHLSSLPETTQKLFGIRTLTNQQQTNVPTREIKPFKNEMERLQHAEKFLKFR